MQKPVIITKFQYIHEVLEQLPEPTSKHPTKYNLGHSILLTPGTALAGIGLDRALYFYREFLLDNKHIDWLKFAYKPEHLELDIDKSEAPGMELYFDEFITILEFWRILAKYLSSTRNI